MRISDWSSDVFSSDLVIGGRRLDRVGHGKSPRRAPGASLQALARHGFPRFPLPLWTSRRSAPGPRIGAAHAARETGWPCESCRAYPYLRYFLETLWRSEERRVGTVCVSTSRSRGSAYHKKNKT